MTSPVLYANDFKDALIGIGTQFNQPVAVYDYDKCLKILQDGGMDEEEAEEYFAFNVTGAYVGPSTPIYVRVGVKTWDEDLEITEDDDENQAG